MNDDNIQFNNINFRKSNGSKEDFLLLQTIHKVAIQKSVIETIGCWDEAFQKTRLETHFNESYSTLEFIMLNKEVIGTINCRSKNFEDEQYEFVEQFYILPQYQGQGIGSYLLKSKLCEDKETRLSVLKKDINTHNFYYKNGFKEYMEDEYQKYMKKMPQLTTKLKI